MSSEIRIKSFLHKGEVYSLVYDPALLKLPSLPQECKEALDAKIQAYVRDKIADKSSFLSKLSYEECSNPRNISRINAKITKELETIRLEAASAFFEKEPGPSPPPAATGGAGIMSISPIPERKTFDELVGSWCDEFLGADQKVELEGHSEDQKLPYILESLKTNFASQDTKIVQTRLISDLNEYLKYPQTLLDLKPSILGTILEIVGSACTPKRLNSYDVLIFLRPHLSGNLQFIENLKLLCEKGLINKVVKQRVIEDLKHEEIKLNDDSSDDDIFKACCTAHPDLRLKTQENFYQLLLDSMIKELEPNPTPWTNTISIEAPPSYDATWKLVPDDNHHTLINPRRIDLNDGAALQEELERLKREFVAHFDQIKPINLYNPESEPINVESAQVLIENLLALDPKKQLKILSLLSSEICKQTLVKRPEEPLVFQKTASIINLYIHSADLANVLIENKSIIFREKEDCKEAGLIGTTNLWINLDINGDGLKQRQEAVQLFSFTKEETYLGLANFQPAKPLGPMLLT